VEAVVLGRESHPSIDDAIGRPATRVHDGVGGQCDSMEYRRLNAALSALGQMNPRWLWSGEHRGIRKTSFCEFSVEGYNKDYRFRTLRSAGEPKDSVDQDSKSVLTTYIRQNRLASWTSVTN
jgi:hypothetical protein